MVEEAKVVVTIQEVYILVDCNLVLVGAYIVVEKILGWVETYVMLKGVVVFALVYNQGDNCVVSAAVGNDLENKLNGLEWLDWVSLMMENEWISWLTADVNELSESLRD